MHEGCHKEQGWAAHLQAPVLGTRTTESSSANAVLIKAATTLRAFAVNT